MNTEKYQSPIEKEIIEKGRFVFVADFVTRMTRKKDNREMINGYQTKRQNGMYKVFFNGSDAGYGMMTAKEINSWFCRLPLNYFALEAEEMVIAVRMAQ